VEIDRNDPYMGDLSFYDFVGDLASYLCQEPLVEELEAS
jgi:hypothetical protein